LKSAWILVTNNAINITRTVLKIMDLFDINIRYTTGFGLI
jgi:hypothetical protein